MLPNGQTGALAHNYHLLLELCDVLEAIADSLPRANAQLCRDTAATLEPLLAQTHRLEEVTLFPLLTASGRPELRHTMTRLRREHVFDSCAAGEVSDVLRSIAAGCSALSPDAVGYLLRSFFDGLRRHVYGEQDLIALFLQNQQEKHQK